MANISKINFDDTTYFIKDEEARTKNSHYIVGTQSTSTSAWTGSLPTIENLYEGLSVDYWLPQPSTASEVTLQLTLANGVATAAIPCYIKGNKRLTDDIPEHTVIRLVYQTINLGNNNVTGWWLESSSNELTFDTTPTAGSINPVTSDGIKTALNSKMPLTNGVLRFTGVTVNTASNAVMARIPASGTNSAITEDHVVVDCVFATSSNITGNIRWDTYNGYMTLTGSCIIATSTDVTLALAGNI